MAARGTFSLTNSDNVDMTLRITMSVKEWKVIKKQLSPSNSNGEWYLDAAINDMIDKADKEFHFYEQVGGEGQ